MTISEQPDKPVEKPAEDQDALHPGFIYQHLQNIANDYRIPMDMDAINAWGGALADKHTKHTDAVKEFTDYVKPMAMGMYPTLAAQIQQGIPTKHLLAPYDMVAKSVLGQDTEANWDHPVWNKALTGNVDEKTGRSAPMSLEHWRQELLTNPEFGYQYTAKGAEHHAQVLNELHNLFNTPKAER